MPTHVSKILPDALAILTSQGATKMTTTDPFTAFPRILEALLNCNNWMQKIIVEVETDYPHMSKLGCKYANESRDAIAALNPAHLRALAEIVVEAVAFGQPGSGWARHKAFFGKIDALPPELIAGAKRFLEGGV